MTLTEVERPLKTIVLDVDVNGTERSLISRSFPAETSYELLFIFRIQTGITVATTKNFLRSFSTETPCEILLFVQNSNSNWHYSKC